MRTLLAAMLGLATATTPAPARQPPVLPEIRVVTAPAGVLAPTTTRLERDDIVAAHKIDLSGLLNLTPGLNVRVGGRGEPRVDMRGFDQRSVLLLLDGVPVTDPWNGIVNINLFPTEMVGAARITRGPSSSLLGPNALAGSIELTTRRPDQGVQTDLGTQWRDSRTWDVRGAASAATGAFSAIAGGRSLTSPGFPLSGSFDDRPANRRRGEDGGLRSNSDREQWSGFGSGSYRWSDDGGVRLSLLGSTAEFGIPPTTTAFLPPFRRIDAQRLLVLQAGVDQTFDRADVEAAVFYDRYESRESIFDGPDFARSILTTRVDGAEVGGLTRIHGTLHPRVHLGGSAQVRRPTAEVSDYGRGHLGSPGVTLVSLGLEGEYLPWSWLSIVLGVSGDLQTGGGRGTESDPNPLGAISADLGEYGALSALAARRTRFPTLRELFDPQQGNANLAAERALTYQLSYRHGHPLGFVEASLYHSAVDDLIEQRATSDGSRFVNLREAVLQGAETTLWARPSDWLHVTLNYTYLDARARNERTGELTRIQHRPEHRLNGVLNLFLPWELLLRIEGLYGSEQLERFGSDVTIDAFGLLNAQLALDVRGTATLFAGANNLLDDDYEERLGTPQPGRWVYLGFRWSFTEEWTT